MAEVFFVCTAFRPDFLADRPISPLIEVHLARPNTETTQNGPYFSAFSSSAPSPLTGPRRSSCFLRFPLGRNPFPLVDVPALRTLLPGSVVTVAIRRNTTISDFGYFRNFEPSSQLGLIEFCLFVFFELRRTGYLHIKDLAPGLGRCLALPRVPGVVSGGP